MDRKKYAVYVELLRGLAGLALIYTTGDWFGLNAYLPNGVYFVGLYFLVTILGGFYFTYAEKPTYSAGLIS